MCLKYDDYYIDLNKYLAGVISIRNDDTVPDFCEGCSSVPEAGPVRLLNNRLGAIFGLIMMTSLRSDGPFSGEGSSSEPLSSSSKGNELEARIFTNNGKILTIWKF